MEVAAEVAMVEGAEWAMAVKATAITFGFFENSPKPDDMTNGMLPYSCPGRKLESIVGRPRIVASAMVPGPALVTITSAISM